MWRNVSDLPEWKRRQHHPCFLKCQAGMPGECPAPWPVTDFISHLHFFVGFPSVLNKQGLHKERQNLSQILSKLLYSGKEHQDSWLILWLQLPPWFPWTQLGFSCKYQLGKESFTSFVLPALGHSCVAMAQPSGYRGAAAGQKTGLISDLLHGAL